jgi:tetratricopeptide (TPR) repeat protein
MSTGSELQIKGIRLFESGKYAEAAETFASAVAAYQAEGNTQLAAEMRVNLGLAQRELGDFKTAVAEMQTGLAHFRAAGDRLHEAQTLGNMALAYSKAEDHEQAQTLYRDAARIFREIGQDDYYGETILALGDMQFRAGKLLEALATFEVGLDYVRNKNQRQKLMKQLLLLKNRISGEQRIAGTPKASEPVSDSRRRRRRGLFQRQSSRDDSADGD